MSEVSAPSAPLDCRAQRLESINRLHQHVNYLSAQLRLEINALTLHDTPFGFRKYVADELSLLLAESPGTADR